MTPSSEEYPYAQYDPVGDQYEDGTPSGYQAREQPGCEP